MFECDIPFSIIVCCLVVARCSKNSILSEPKWGAQAAVGGGARLAWPPRSDGTGSEYLLPFVRFVLSDTC